MSILTPLHHDLKNKSGPVQKAFGVVEVQGVGKNVRYIDIDTAGHSDERPRKFGDEYIIRVYFHKNKHDDLCLNDWGLWRQATLTAALPEEVIDEGLDGLVIKTDGLVEPNTGNTLDQQYSFVLSSRSGAINTFDAYEVDYEQSKEAQKVFTYFYMQVEDTQALLESLKKKEGKK